PSRMMSFAGIEVCSAPQIHRLLRRRGRPQRTMVCPTEAGQSKLTSRPKAYSHKILLTLVVHSHYLLAQTGSALRSPEAKVTPRQLARVGAMLRMSIEPRSRPCSIPGPAIKKEACNSG